MVPCHRDTPVAPAGECTNPKPRRATRPRLMTSHTQGRGGRAAGPEGVPGTAQTRQGVRSLPGGGAATMVGSLAMGGGSGQGGGAFRSVPPSRPHWLRSNSVMAAADDRIYSLLASNRPIPVGPHPYLFPMPGPGGRVPCGGWLARFAPTHPPVSHRSLSSPGADHHSRSHPRGHGFSSYCPSDGPLPSAENWN